MARPSANQHRPRDRATGRRVLGAPWRPGDEAVVDRHNLPYFGMVIVGVDHGYVGQMTLDEITGGSPYGHDDGDGWRLPTANKLHGQYPVGPKRPPFSHFVIPRLGGWAGGRTSLCLAGAEKYRQRAEFLGWAMSDTPKAVTGAEGAASDREQELRLVVETIPTPVWRAGPEGNIEYVNKRALDYFGAPLGEILGWGWMEKVHPDDVAFKVKTWLKNLQSETPHEAVCRFRGADGQYRWFNVRGEPLRASDGRVHHWYGVLIDIDDRRKAEDAVRESEYKLRKIIETVPGLVWSTGPDGEPTQLNRRVLDYSGIQFEDFLQLGWKQFLHPDDFPETARAFSHAIQTGTSYQAVHRLRRTDGEYRWYHARAEPLRDERERIIQWYGLSIDIDEGKKAEEELRSTQARLARAAQIATVAELSASIAHEINQPLAAIVANAQTCQAWLSADNPNVARAKVAVDRIIRDATAVADVVRRIRALFKKAAPDKALLQINEVVEEVWRLLQSEMNRRGVQAELDLAEHLPPTAADRIQVQQVLMNLIRNAAEATEASEGPRQLIVRSRHVEGRIMVEVCDSGAGIADKEKVFEPFYSTKQNGMGMGLAISRSIIRAHEGELWARDNLPRGTIFAFTLPTS